MIYNLFCAFNYNIFLFFVKAPRTPTFHWREDADVSRHRKTHLKRLMEPIKISNPTPEDTTITRLIDSLQDVFERAKHLYPGYCISVSWNTESHPNEIKSIHRYDPENDLIQEFATLSNHTLQSEIYDSWEEV